ncbi:uncharacterized protein LOC130813785 [Amaranthus tricolor]|uniref:uncharacterized protein LOC130813785 n=1 Tax=Amaranthus tricolor TaxID=29722 RepID=UPI0025879C67|nr:uncharacterized protein LOC130813785 [Amaranthus tricolor]
MASPKKRFQFSSWLVILTIISSSFATPQHGVFRQKSLQGGPTTSKSYLSKDVKVLYYDQTLDHFNYQPQSYTKFKQKYLLYSKHWGGSKTNSPILAYLGDEEPLSNNEVDHLILPDYAKKLKALVVVMEHRFYGESKPFGISSMDEIVKNASVRGYFNSAQALADFAELITYLRETLSAHHSPVIVLGGSYGGMLASWFRLKYPHIALGALASSAPVLYFDNIIKPEDGYYAVVTKDFKETSESCYKTIKRSWDKINKIGSLPKGPLYLSKKFNTCAELNETNELTKLLENMYDVVAQYGNLVINTSKICKAIDEGSKGKDIISRIYAGALAYFNGTIKCLDTQFFNKQYPETNVGYAWQRCSEMVMPIAISTSKMSMFPSYTFDLQQFSLHCKETYNVIPRPHWITTYYGGHDIKLTLKRFGSNIIFSNGLTDPYSSAGVLQNLSENIIAVYTKQGSHCMDILAAKEDDPDWLINQREREIKIISGWIKKYQEDLHKYLNN